MSLNEGTPRVLIADDDPAMRLLAEEALKHIGISSICAEDGAQALELFKAERPDIILLDVMMPEMDGLEVCRAIRAQPEGTDIPIAMVTCLDDIQSIKDAYEAGANDFITKPINWIVLNERVRFMYKSAKNAEALIKSQKLLSDAQRIAQLGSWEWELENDIFRCSEQLYRIFEIKTPSEPVSWNLLMKQVVPDDLKIVRQNIQTAKNRGIPFNLDFRIYCNGSSEKTLSLQVEVASFKEDSPSVLAGTFQDITERKRAELLEAGRNRILQMVIQNRPLHEILGYIVHILQEQRPQAIGCISLLRGERIFVMSAPDLPKSLVELTHGLPVGPRSGCCGTSAYLGQSVAASDISTSPFWEDFREVALANDIQSCFTIPFFSGKGQVLGTISQFHHHCYQPTNRDLKTAEVMAKLAAIAVEQRQLSNRLLHQAQHDSLTGLLNRETISQSLDLTLKQLSRHPSQGAVLLVDLDRFKSVNDTLGHHVGDLLLKQVSKALEKCTRGSDVLGRLGGDEFVLVLTSIEDRKAAARVAERIIASLEKPFRISGQEIYVGASIGMSVFPDDGIDSVDLLKNADIAMFFAKNEGGGRFHFFNEEMNAAVIERLEIENNIRKGLERGEFELHYQPQYTLNDGKLVSVEALIRWNHPDLGVIPPNRFIPVAEESRLIIPLGSWVMEEACRQNAKWQRNGFRKVRVAVNVSAVQMMEADFIDMVSDALEKSGLDPKWLEIEITETVFRNDKGHVRKNLDALNGMGIATTIDDFGTGYSSITYLRKMPLNCLKIDRSFLSEIQKKGLVSHQSLNLVKTFVNLAHNLDLEVVAEGVENVSQHKLMVQLGCNNAQGFLFSPPVQSQDVPELFDKTIDLCFKEF
jgi:diguanylate cyclase (GGDEF)-like protein